MQAVAQRSAKSCFRCILSPRRGEHRKVSVAIFETRHSWVAPFSQKPKSCVIVLVKKTNYYISILRTKTLCYQYSLALIFPTMYSSERIRVTVTFCLYPYLWKVLRYWSTPPWSKRNLFLPFPSYQLSGSHNLIANYNFQATQYRGFSFVLICHAGCHYCQAGFFLFPWW